MSCGPCEQAKNFVNKTSNIIEGWSNLIVTDPEIELIAEARYEVCLSCLDKRELIVINNIQRYLCLICKCPIDAKIRSRDEACPKGDW